MMNTTLRWIARSSVVLAAATGLGGLTGALAGDQPRSPTHFTGVLNDFTPSAKVTKGGPYQMAGKWSLEVDQRHGTARFEAAMNMETSDYAMTADTVDNPGVSRGAHTHHILLTDGVIGTDTDWMTACPVFNPVVKSGFVVRGTANVTGNGSAAPFGNPSTLTLCVLGGDIVTFANFTMAFGLPASGHFGTQAIHGVVLHCDGPWGHDSKECKIDLPTP